MKALRFLLPVVLMSLGTVAFAQSDAHKMAETKTAAPKSEAQTSFDTLKTLAGNWEDKPIHISMRETSRGNVLVHEMQEAGTPLDPTKYDHPVTMMFVDAD